MTMIPCMICSGDGSVEEGRDCPTCNGDGEIVAGFGMTEGHRMAMFNMIIELVTNTARPTNVFDSYIIIEELDTTEYNALTDTQKNGILYLLACGKVDLNTGKAGRVRLWHWFGAESTTVANLTALLE